MSSTVQLDQRTPAPGHSPAWNGMRMDPVLFGGCFGWLHLPIEGTAADLAVLLCPAVGAEARRAYRTMRKLASLLAASGVPTLRFEYPGTGNSRDLHAGEEPLAAWRDSVHAAADWLRAQTGATRVVIAGLRLGGLLAADAAAARGDVAGLALLAPVVSGRAYLRDLRVMARTARYPMPHLDGGMELDGTALPAATLAALPGLDLTGTAGAAPPVVLLLDPDGGAEPYAGALRDRGVAVSGDGFPGFAALMRCAVDNAVPYEALDRVADWLRPLAAGTAGGGIPHPVAPEASLHLPGCVERPLRFGPDGALFGVLCRPDEGSMPGFAVVIGNTGGDPHQGIGRFGVALSRHLARQGIAAVRLDFSGLGDSVHAADADHLHAFETDRAAEMGAVFDLLSGLGVHRFGTVGICSGAYHAWKAVAADRRVTAAALINSLTFAWQAGGTEELVLRDNGRSTRFYLRRVCQAGFWRVLLRGGVQLRNPMRVLAARVRRRAALAAQRIAARVTMPLGLGGAAGPASTLRAVSARGARVLLLHSFDDASVDALEEQFGPAGCRATALPGVAVRLERELDHDLSTTAMQVRVTAILSEFFGQAASAAERR